MSEAARLAFVGTGTCNPTGRGLPCLALSDGTSIALVDCGGGSYHRLSLIDDPAFSPGRVDTVLLTHYHIDHVSGLPDLIWGETWAQSGPRTRPLAIVGPPGLMEFINGRLLPFLGDYRVPFDIVPIELGGTDSYRSEFFSARTYEMAHGMPATGYLISHERGALAVSGDTALCDGLKELLAASSAAVIEWGMPGNSTHECHLGAADIMELLQSGSFPPRVYATHMYFFHGDIPAAEIEWKKRLLAATGGTEFLFPGDGDIFDL